MHTCACTHTHTLTHAHTHTCAHTHAYKTAATVVHILAVWKA